MGTQPRPPISDGHTLHDASQKNVEVAHRFAMSHFSREAVPGTGFEPVRLSTGTFQEPASAIFATRAYCLNHHKTKLTLG